MIKLIIALGNPGLKYQLTRHNAGWLVFDEFFHDKNPVWKSKFKGEYCSMSIRGENIYFLKPGTFMNLSGESAQALTKFFKIKPREILVVYDEIDLPLGTIAFKKGGGLAGHNGLKSLNQHLGSKDFMRLRIGVSRPQHGTVSSWVLSNFKTEETILLEKVLRLSAESLEMLLSDGYEKAATKYSRQDLR